MTDITAADTKYIKRRDRGLEHAWQFQYEIEPIKETKYFSDKKYGSKEASLVAAQQYRDEFLDSACELGIVSPEWRSLAPDLPIHLSLSARNTSGINGVCRVASKRKPGRLQVHWSANFRDNRGTQKQKKFYVATLGEKAALVSAIVFRANFVATVASHAPLIQRAPIESHRDDLLFLSEYIESLVEEGELFYFLNALNNPALSATEKEAIVAARIGQTRFRKNVLASWNNCCCVTRSTLFVVASHIKPWATSTDEERLDSFNGLALSPNLDKAFDSGMISFANSGNVILSPRLGQDAPRLGISGRETISGLHERYLKYLDYHRESVFQRT